MASRVITVAQDGSGDCRTVQEAIDSVPLCNTCRTVIRVSPGVYRQPVYVPKTKNLITLAGLRPEDTVLTWNNTATKIDHHQVIPSFWFYPVEFSTRGGSFGRLINDFILFFGWCRRLGWLVLGRLGVGVPLLKERTLLLKTSLLRTLLLRQSLCFFFLFNFGNVYSFLGNGFTWKRFNFWGLFGWSISFELFMFGVCWNMK